MLFLDRLGPNLTSCNNSLFQKATSDKRPSLLACNTITKELQLIQQSQLLTQVMQSNSWFSAQPNMQPNDLPVLQGKSVLWKNQVVEATIFLSAEIELLQSYDINLNTCRHKLVLDGYLTHFFCIQEMLISRNEREMVDARYFVCENKTCLQSIKNIFSVGSFFS